MKNRIDGDGKATLTVDQLERRYRADRRRAGVKLHVLSIDDWSAEDLAEVNKYCEAKQVSRSEYVAEAMQRYMARKESELVPYTLMLPRYHRDFIEAVEGLLPGEMKDWMTSVIDQIERDAVPFGSFHELFLWRRAELDPKTERALDVVLTDFVKASARVKAGCVEVES